MKRVLMAAACLLIMSGCTAHYFEVDDNLLTMYLDKPGAQRVFLASSLDGFRPREVPKVEGRWKIVLPSFASFRYFYIVDDTIYLPDCRMREKDDFGSENCIFDPRM